MAGKARAACMTLLPLLVADNIGPRMLFCNLFPSKDHLSAAGIASTSQPGGSTRHLEKLYKYSWPCVLAGSVPTVPHL